MASAKKSPNRSLNFFNIDLHVSVIEDIRYIFKKLGHYVDDWSLSGHTWVVGKKKAVIPLCDGTNFSGCCSREVCDLFYQTYKDKFAQYDGFIACYPVEYALLYEKWNKPIIVVNCIRYEHPYTDNPTMWNYLTTMLQKFKAEGRLWYVSNNKGDQYYTKYFTGIEPTWIPSLCEYVEQDCSWSPASDPKYSKVLVSNRTDSKDMPADLILPISHARDSDTATSYSWKEVYKYRGVIHVPYHNGSMSIFEHYTGNLPMFIPSKKFARELIRKGEMFNDLTFYKLRNIPEPADPDNPNNLSNSKNVDMWIDTCDIYDPENMPYCIQFDSYKHLKTLLKTVDTAEISSKMREFNKLRKQYVYSSWSNILREIALW